MCIRDSTVISGYVQMMQGADKRPLREEYAELALKQSGLKAKVFVVSSAVEAPEANKWGISASSISGRGFVVRKHAYAVVTVDSGFYVLTYPATERGYDNSVDKFAGLMGSFVPRAAGPNGPKFRVPGPASR